VMNEYRSIPLWMNKPSARNASPRHASKVYRSIWISDFHLGTRGCKASALYSFLRSVKAENLYLAGDIVDGWNLGPSWYWSAAQNQVVAELAAWRRYGARIVFVPGNHDDISLIESLLGLSPHRGELIHVTAGGCRLLVTHGHEFDSSLSSARWLSLMGGKAYSAALRINEWYCRERFRCSDAPRFLSGYWKAPVRSAVRYLTTAHLDEQAVVEKARRHRADAIVSGHLHRTEQRLIGPIWYINDGDWVQNRTALAENHDGTLCLIRWGHDQPGAAPTIASEAETHYVEPAAS
jgi:UDP-2,3-diacylglucosamine pyrophosphatase LpxH